MGKEAGSRPTFSSAARTIGTLFAKAAVLEPPAPIQPSAMADGWMGAGGSSNAAFAQSVPLIRAALEKRGRDPVAFPISKRVFMSVHERPEVAQAEVHRWFSVVYRNPDLTTTGGVYGTPEQVREQLQELVAMGANHLLLNPVTRYTEQVEALAEVVGLRHEDR
jgi:alkanesulfonate monooxygenase SsuD/methylene tetrahydromethanopterin reductase-like flavin-dependent oxidoreductase (luciferase family)